MKKIDKIKIKTNPAVKCMDDKKKENLNVSSWEVCAGSTTTKPTKIHSSKKNINIQKKRGIQIALVNLLTILTALVTFCWILI